MLTLAVAQVVQIPVVALTLLAGAVIPVITAVITNARTSSAVKAVVNAGLAAVAGGVTAALATEGRVVPSVWLLGIATAFVGSVTSYHGLLNPTGIVDAINRALPGGVGATVVATAAETLEHVAPAAIQQVFAAPITAAENVGVAVPPGSTVTISHAGKAGTAASAAAKPGVAGAPTPPPSSPPPPLGV